MPAYLKPLGKGRPVLLDKPILFVGRHPECDIVLLNSRKVSRKHCCIAVVNNTVKVRDLGSTNGISVNGTRVRKEAEVSIGDELVIGDVAYRLLKGDPPPDESPRNDPETSSRDEVLPLVPGSNRPPASSLELSQEFPVAIDEPISVSKLAPQKASPKSPAKNPPAKPAGKPRKSKDDSDQDVIILDESQYSFDDED